MGIKNKLFRHLYKKSPLNIAGFFHQIYVTQDVAGLLSPQQRHMPLNLAMHFG